MAGLTGKITNGAVIGLQKTSVNWQGKQRRFPSTPLLDLRANVQKGRSDVVKKCYESEKLLVEKCGRKKRFK